MECLNPTDFGHGTVRCGQCKPCRVNRKREWQGRLEIERSDHGVFSAFCTLTYAPEYVPNTQSGLATLSKDQAKAFMARLLVRIQRKYNIRLRYFLVGEYGEKSGRPHYHALIFGMDPNHLDQEIKSLWRNTQQGKKSTETESLGFSMTLPMGNGASAYTTGYVIKKLTSDKSFSDGREPEFSIMTRRPALGHSILPKIADKYAELNSLPLFNLGTQETSPEEKTELWCMATGYYRLEGSIYPMDTVMQAKLRKLLLAKHNVDYRPDVQKTLRDYLHSKKDLTGFNPIAQLDRRLEAETKSQRLYEKQELGKKAI